jgi:hypothetical protein
LPNGYDASVGRRYLSRRYDGSAEIRLAGSPIKVVAVCIFEKVVFTVLVPVQFKKVVLTLFSFRAALCQSKTHNRPPCYGLTTQFKTIGQ